MSQVSDQWAAASTYEHFMGRWSRVLAHEFVVWLQVNDGADWLDIGCGTGALTNAICDVAHPGSVVACDPSESFIEYARAHCHDDRASFLVAAAENFPVRFQGYGSITSLLALNFFPNPAAALARMCSAAGPDCVVSACVWDYARGMQFLRYFWDAAAEIAPVSRQYDEGVRFPICNPDGLTELFEGAGITDIRCEPIDIATSFTSFADYWQPLLGGTGPAPAFVAALGPDDQGLLRRRLEARLPVAADGAINLCARAWAIRGRGSPRVAHHE